jgi:hypothetical protein
MLGLFPWMTSHGAMFDDVFLNPGQTMLKHPLAGDTPIYHCNDKSHKLFEQCDRPLHELLL